MRKFLVLLAVGSSLCAFSYAQSSQRADLPPDAQPSEQSAPQPSLGDYARQLRLKKQQKEAQLQQAKAKEAEPSDVRTDVQTAVATPATPPKAPHIVTNDDTPERATLTTASVHEKVPSESEPQPTATDRNALAENLKSQILAQKGAIAALEEDIKKLGDSIHFAGANCVANCSQWNEHQQQKQQEVETMKTQLDEQRKLLEQLQDEARKAGFGSSVTEP
jgi:hypothetical protein